MATVAFTAAAEADFDDIIDYSFVTFGSRVANEYLRDLESARMRLVDFPEVGFVVAELRQQSRCLPCRQHRIYYHYDGTTVLVLPILHHAMDPNKWLE